MIGRRTAIYISLLGALVFCAVGAQGASAAAARAITPFTCVENGGAKDFSDPHCDKKVTPGTGKYGHVEIAPGTKTKIVVSNEQTKNETTEASPAILKGTIAGVKSEITCNTVSGEGELTPEEPEAKRHRVIIVIRTRLSSCTVNKPAGFGCKAKEPLEFSLNGEGVEELGAGKNENGIEFKPTGEHFGQLTLEGCIFAGTFNIDGTAVATGTPAATESFTGATLRFTNAMTKETLKIAGNAAELESVKTLRMAPINGVPQNPISFTKVT